MSNGGQMHPVDSDPSTPNANVIAPNSQGSKRKRQYTGQGLHGKRNATFTCELPTVGQAVEYYSTHVENARFREITGNRKPRQGYKCQNYRCTYEDERKGDECCEAGLTIYTYDDDPLVYIHKRGWHNHPENEVPNTTNQARAPIAGYVPDVSGVEQVLREDEIPDQGETPQNPDVTANGVDAHFLSVLAVTPEPVHARQLSRASTGGLGLHGKRDATYISSANSIQEAVEYYSEHIAHQRFRDITGRRNQKSVYQCRTYHCAYNYPLQDNECPSGLSVYAYEDDAQIYIHRKCSHYHDGEWIPQTAEELVLTVSQGPEPTLPKPRQDRPSLGLSGQRPATSAVNGSPNRQSPTAQAQNNSQRGTRPGTQGLSRNVRVRAATEKANREKEAREVERQARLQEMYEGDPDADPIFRSTSQPGGEDDNVSSSSSEAYDNIPLQHVPKLGKRLRTCLRAGGFTEFQTRQVLHTLQASLMSWGSSVDITAGSSASRESTTRPGHGRI